MLGFYCIGVVTAVKAKPMKKNKKKAKGFKRSSDISYNGV